MIYPLPWFLAMDLSDGVCLKRIYGCIIWAVLVDFISPRCFMSLQDLKALARTPPKIHKSFILAGDGLVTWTEVLTQCTEDFSSDEGFDDQFEVQTPVKFGDFAMEMDDKPKGLNMVNIEKVHSGRVSEISFMGNIFGCPGDGFGCRPGLELDNCVDSPFKVFPEDTPVFDDGIHLLKVMNQVKGSEFSSVDSPVEGHVDFSVEGSVVSPVVTPFHKNSRHGKRRTIHVIKIKDLNPVLLVVGADVKLNEVILTNAHTLVRHFGGRKFNATGLKKWVSETWMACISQCPEVYILPRGWIAFKFYDVSDSDSILAGSWRWEGSGLLLKRWTPLFDPRTERENNTEADKASKEGLRLAEGTWMVKEFTNGRLQAFYHRLFIEQL